MTPVLCFDTAKLPREEQFQAYERFHPMFKARCADPAGGFAARFDTWFLGSVILTSYQTDAGELMRTAEQIKSDGVDNYAVQYTRSGGWTGVFDERPMAGRPGEAVVLDFTRPMTFRSVRGEVAVLLIARDVLDEILPPFDVHGLTLADGAGGVVVDHLESLLRRLPSLEPEDADRVCKGTLDVLVSGLENLRPTRGPVESAAGLLTRAKRHILRNLERDLSSDAICAALGVSRASLYRTFEPMGGVAAYVQHRRLRRVYGLLGRVDERRSVSEIAYAFQFTNTDHFSRRFKAEFGCTPTEHRRLAHERLVAPPPGEPTAIDGEKVRTIEALSDAVNRTPVAKDRRPMIESRTQPMTKPAGL